MNNSAALSILLDVNHMVDALKGHLVPQSVEELLLLDTTAAEVAATNAATLLGSEHCLDLLEFVLQRDLGYTEDQAAMVADLYYEVSDQTGGEWVTAEQGRASADTLKLPPTFAGEGRGQVDFEDRQVLGAALTQAHLGPVVVVTRDGGLHNIGHAVATERVQIMHARNLRVALRAIRKTRR